MASREPIECPVCRDLPSPGQQLEDHLVDKHPKRKLAKFIVAETTALTTDDISE
ncbi:hypothetical protein [Natrinema salsiterrestre]|uniref:Uncharacterized protein n=1 Tax=Natrinema salsiterrestre TaxID=2950540 RepID=A0A9Q4L2K6_9EURY|nr:hypothetical protein [Natrinema salsiterrestre]MDF9744191.1 hypothetical protein [Natrinema salsiterrestre]